MNFQGFHVNSTLIGKTNGKSNEVNRVPEDDMAEIKRMIGAVEEQILKK